MWGMAYVCATQPEHLLNLPESAVLIEIIPEANQTDAFYAAMSV
jgi:2-succinyl-5-enolpyruvyl-6-hydroxy-3-cyclohexene-1-carboxylate synthase